VDLALLILLAVFGLIAAVLLFALMKVSHDQDRQARKHEKSLDPFSDVSITR
jgi:type II secretory pathway pseudopilin PulG